MQKGKSRRILNLVLRVLVKRIDFAHTKPVAGEGPDERESLGLDTTLRLLDGRVSEIKSSWLEILV